MHHKILLCSDCFKDEGLKLDSFQIGVEDSENCPNCYSNTGKKLSSYLVSELAYRFFVQGTVHKTAYGAASILQFNEYQKTCVDFAKPLSVDAKLIEKVLGVGFFYNAPRMWMVGEIKPLKRMQSKLKRNQVFEEIIASYPTIYLTKNHTFYRIRKNPQNPESHAQYDSPPKSGGGRLDSNRFPVLYGSQDLEVCIHECRVTVEDQILFATMKPESPLKMLDLTVQLIEKGKTEFESLDLAVKMLYSATSHSYDILRSLAKAVKRAGFDGIVYPSYFSTVSNGISSNVYSSSTRFPSYSKTDSYLIPNIALFGRPIKSKKVSVNCINRLLLDKVEYSVLFGPVRY